MPRLMPQRTVLIAFLSASGVLAVVAGLSIVKSFAQGAAVDLSAPALQVHARLTQNDRVGPPLAGSLDHAHSVATSKGLPWKGLQRIVDDSPGNVSGLTSAAILEIYQKQACDADSVVIGHPSAWVHHLSASGTVVYADYDFVIDRLLKDNQASSLQSRHDIVVTRPGGTFSLANGPVTFESLAFPHLQSGASYVQFLRYIPESSSYQAIDPFSTLIAIGTNWMIARTAFSKLVLPGFALGALEPAIDG
jgi:hypothetical protein